MSLLDVGVFEIDGEDIWGLSMVEVLNGSPIPGEL